MKKLLAYLRSLPRSWKYVWLFIFCGFITLDAFAPGFFGITILKLLGIALCPIYIAQYFKHDKYLLLAFILTFVADILLTVNNASNFGIFTFIMAQFLHFVRLQPTNSPLKRPYVIAISASIIIAFLSFTALGFYSIFLLCTLYAFFLVSNIYLSFIWFKSAKSRAKKPATFALVGFLLFLCCDLCAASSFFCTIHAFPLLLKRLFDFLCWLFYYPSQILISNSSKKNTNM